MSKPSNNIQVYLHCLECVQSRPSDQSPAEYARLNTGMTPIGLQIWCVRHNCSVAQFDFEGHTPIYIDESFN